MAGVILLSVICGSLCAYCLYIASLPPDEAKRSADEPV